MKKKELIKYILLFFFFFASLVFIFTLSRGDTFVNYGFSYAISRGEIPYKDFNMIITPFAPFLYSIGLFVCKNILVYYFEQAFLLTCMFYLLEKLIGKKSILFLLFLIVPYPVAMVSTVFPGYNFLLVFMFILFIYCFKNNCSDYLLGIILGLIFCTKQTIGLVLFLPTFYYLFKNRKKFFKICIGYLIPIVCLLLYLLITGCLNEFVNLCFLGLFDFNNGNSQIDIFYFIVFLIGIAYLLFRIYKEPKNVLLYYGLLFSSVIIPIVDYYHVSLFLVIVCYFFVENISIKKEYYKYLKIGIISLTVIWGVVTYIYFRKPVISNFNNFNWVVWEKGYVKNVNELLQFVDKSDKKVIYFMRGSENYYFKIINNQKLDYFDLPNCGNYGYNGINKMKMKINKEHNVYFVIDRELVKNNDANQQYLKQLGEYVINESSFVKEIGLYDVYYKE